MMAGGQRKGHGQRQRGEEGVCPQLRAGVPKDSILLACVYVSVSLTSCCSVLHEGNTPVKLQKPGTDSTGQAPLSVHDVIPCVTGVYTTWTHSIIISNYMSQVTYLIKSAL